MGKTKVSFPLRVLDNSAEEPTQRVIITAKATPKGYLTASRQIIIADNDGPALKLQLYRTQVRENIGSFVATVARQYKDPGQLQEALTLNLYSDDRNIIVPRYVTIPAGSTRRELSRYRDR